MVQRQKYSFSTVPCTCSTSTALAVSFRLFIILSHKTAVKTTDANQIEQNVKYVQNIQEAHGDNLVQPQCQQRESLSQTV